MRSLKKSIREFFPVFLGVILALFFNNINESRIEKAKINGLLEKIELGTAKNLENLDKQLRQNQKILDSMVYYQDDSNLSIGDVKAKTGGVRYIQFDLAAWNVLNSSELLVDVNYELVSFLYLLSESIDNSETLDIANNLSTKEAKEEFISNLSDYLVDIKHRIYLSNKIQELLRERN